MARNLDEHLRNAKYKGATPVDGTKKSGGKIVQSHLFETRVSGRKSWFIANEDTSGTISFYSISDSANILDHIKK